MNTNALTQRRKGSQRHQDETGFEELGSSPGRTLLAGSASLRGLCDFALKSVGFAALIALCFTVPAYGVDSDGDGMSDVWQSLYGVASGDAGDDPDGDGAINLHEGRAGTDPSEISSHPWLDSSRSGDQVTLSWDGVASMRYVLVASSNLVTWSQVGSEILSAGATESGLDTLPARGAREYRVRIRTNYDTDTDGLTDWEEAILGTNEGASDTEEDGMPDGWEYIHSLDPFGDDSGDDADEDTYSNLTEYLNGTNPRDPGSY